jgi:integrase
MDKNSLLKPITIKRKAEIVKYYVNPLIGNKTEINPMDIYEELESRKLSPATINRIFIILRETCKIRNICYNELMMAQVMKVLGVRARACRRHGLSEEKAQTLLRVVKEKHPNFYPYVLFGLHTGARAGEMFGLEWRDLVRINKNKYILIRRSLDQEHTKNYVSKQIPATKELVECLHSLHRKLKRKKKFPDRYTKVFKFTRLSRAFKRIKKDLPFDDMVSYHILRHTFATILLNKGVIHKDVQQLLGHKSIMTTLDMYWTRPMSTTLDGLVPSIKGE